jgi:hypothetical protein
VTIEITIDAGYVLLIHQGVKAAHDELERRQNEEQRVRYELGEKEIRIQVSIDIKSSNDRF